MKLKIREKLSLLFTFIFAVLLLAILSGIYIQVDKNREKNFFHKLEERASIVGQFYLAEDDLTAEKFKLVLKKYNDELANEVVRIYDVDYKPVFIAEGDTKWSKDVIAEIIENKKLFFATGQENTVGIFYKDNLGDFVVIASAKDVDGIQDMRYLLNAMLLSYCIAVLITYFIGRFFSKRALKPISSIIKQVRIIKTTSLSNRLPVSQQQRDEIDELSLTINNMLEHIEQSVENQTNFIHNASHELKTPIASMLLNTEISLRKERSQQEYKAILESLLEDVVRLELLVNSLLELSQASIAENLEPVYLPELLQEIVSDYSRQNENIKLRFVFARKREKDTLNGSRQLLSIAIGNLIKNAVKFSDGKEVICEYVQYPNDVMIHITDNGPGIPTAEVEHVFRPFYRGTNGHGHKGFGIGLALVKKIVSLHNGKIKLHTVPKTGTTFTIVLPR